jgi:hypothetical protein
VDDAPEEGRAPAHRLDDLPVVVVDGEHAPHLALVESGLLQQSEAASPHVRVASSRAGCPDVMQEAGDAEVLPDRHRELQPFGEQQRVLADAETVQPVRGRFRRVPPQLVVPRLQLEQVGHHAPQRQDVHPPSLRESIPGVLHQLDASRDESLRIEPVGGRRGRLAREAEAVEERGLHVVDSLGEQRTAQRRARALRRRLGVQSYQ